MALGSPSGRVESRKPAGEGVRDQCDSRRRASTLSEQSLSSFLPALDTLFVPLLVGTGVALVTGASVLATITCCFMKRLRKR